MKDKLKKIIPYTAGAFASSTVIALFFTPPKYIALITAGLMVFIIGMLVFGIVKLVIED